MSRLASLVGVSLALAFERRDTQSLMAPAQEDGYKWESNLPYFLPTVKCVEVLSLRNSNSLHGLTEELEAIGLANRTEYLIQVPDPEGKAAGCFRGHVKMWNNALAKGCETALILEDDARFEGATLQQGMHAADLFLRSKTPFDLYFLGWNANFFAGYFPPENRTRVHEVPGLNCSYNVHFWFETHAYIISRDAMQLYKDLQYQGVPIDDLLSFSWDRDRFFVARPKIAFQALHRSQAVAQDNGVKTDGPDQVISETPFIWYMIVERNVWNASNVTSPPECRAGLDAYTTTPDLYPNPTPLPQQEVIDELPRWFARNYFPRGALPWKSMNDTNATNHSNP